MSTVEASGIAEPVGHQGARVDITQRPAIALTGWFAVLVLAGCVWLMVLAAQHGSGWLWLPLVVSVLVITSLVIVAPGQTSVVQFFGSYVGTVRRPGFWWVLPLTVRRRVSVRVRNFETNRLKVNDSDGNPVEIAAIVVWQVADTARSTYAVDDYQNFVSVQAESALRHVATSHPYDDPPTPERRCAAPPTSSPASWPTRSPRGSRSPASRSSRSGSPTSPTRRRSPRRCCAGSRPTRSSRPARIVEGAVGMVELALTRLTEHDVVDLDEERKASMVSNLLVVLCGDQPPSPVVNAGSLYT